MTGSQVPVAVLHCVHGAQAFGVPPVQMPLWHVSPVVQALPSLQVVPFLETSGTQVPCVGLHRRHWPQVTFTGPWTHAPFWQVSDVQRLPVSHGVPFWTGVRTQPVAGLHVSTVHGLPSPQFLGVPSHVPAAVHASLVVQAF